MSSTPAPLPPSVGQVIGIEVDAAAVLTREGGDLASPRKQPGRLAYANVTMTRPLTRDLTFWNWMPEVVAGAPAQQKMTVMLLDSQANPAVLRQFRNAFTVRWTGRALNALSNDVAMETLEIAHSGFTMTLP